MCGAHSGQGDNNLTIVEIMKYTKKIIIAYTDLGVAIPNDLERIVKLLDHICTLAEDNDRFRTALNKLARLGNGELLGNSDGNMIARRAIQGDDPKTMEEITHIEGTHGGEF